MSDHPSNKELAEMFKEHADADERFQEESRKADVSLQETLENIQNRLDPKHKDYINRALEEQVAKIAKDQAPLLEIHNGFVFGKKALVVFATVLGSSSTIVATFYFLYKFLRGT